MAQTLRFEELEFYTDDEPEEDFSVFLSDDEDDEIKIPIEKCETVDLPDDFEVPLKNEAEVQDSGESLLDSLLGEALSGEEIRPKFEGLFDDLEDSDEGEPEKFDRRLLEDDDSGIEASRSTSEESPSDESVFDMSAIDTYLQYIAEEEHAVSVDDLPDFASKKNVYGTSFNIRTGAIHRPSKFEFARMYSSCIDACKVLTYDPKKPICELLTLGKIVKPVKLGVKIDFTNSQFTDVFCKTADEMLTMETYHIQEIIRDAFNSHRLAVLMLGIDCDGRVTGCKMDARKQDNLRLALDTAIQTEFEPPVENVLDAIDINFVPVEDVKDTHLVVIRVKQLRRNQTYHLKSSLENIC